MPHVSTDQPRFSRLLAAVLLLSLPALSGCLTTEPATLTAESITSSAAIPRGYQVDVPAGFTAQALPEYLPHVPYTPQWLETEEASGFSSITATQALEQKLRADLLLYRRPNYRAYFSTGGEDILLVSLDQQDMAAPSPFLVFSTINAHNTAGAAAFPPLRDGNLSSLASWLAGTLATEATDVSVETRTIAGRQWVWLAARLATPFTYPDLDQSTADSEPQTSDETSDQTASADAFEEPSEVPSPDAPKPVEWYFLYAITRSKDMLYAVEGWARPNDLTRMTDAMEMMTASLLTGYQRTPEEIAPPPTDRTDAANIPTETSTAAKTAH
ncbi:hypothetical protein [Ruficoccus sp. ZRK36]|uniref:hypothetical protein n=1 Tax=Ruficoccus sp. ZRK36 TaxID=2866311 RepID=UPI001C732D7C|nr:hypothetical protein [Ruficoccus sp. ZRK36]QYY34429.1 hypothetical protein K0V07_08905 [Ruficoccus sp. ZRK36]